MAHIFYLYILKIRIILLKPRHKPPAMLHRHGAVVITMHDKHGLAYLINELDRRDTIDCGSLILSQEAISRQPASYSTQVRNPRPGSNAIEHGVLPGSRHKGGITPVAPTENRKLVRIRNSPVHQFLYSVFDVVLHFQAPLGVTRLPE